LTVFVKFFQLQNNGRKISSGWPSW